MYVLFGYAIPTDPKPNHFWIIYEGVEYTQEWVKIVAYTTSKTTRQL